MTRALVVGALGGIFAGLCEAGLVLARSGQGLSPVRLVACVIICVVALGGVGMVLAVVFTSLVVGARLVLPRLADDRRVGAVAVLLALPVLVHASLAMWTGAQAARIPGKPVISLFLVSVCSLVIYLVARWVAHSCAIKKLGPTGSVVLALGFGMVAVSLCAVNLRVLPRLYPWFHLGLSASTLAASLAAFGLLLSRKTPGRAALFGLVTGLVLTGTWAGHQLSSHGELRVLVFGKTEATARVLLLSRTFFAGTSGKRLARLSTERGRPRSPDSLPPGPVFRDASVLLITIDALRSDHVGAYGYARPISPNIDALAAQGIRFERAYAQAPHTSFSIASLLTGKYYSMLVRVQEGSPRESLAFVLREQGWRTAAFYPPAVFFVDGERLAGFRDSHFGFEYVKCEYMDAELRLAQIAEYFDTIGKARTFVWVHFFEPHEPYLRHAGFDLGPMAIDRYDSEIAYTDAVVGRLVRDFRSRRPESIVILTADHGEEFDDHGGRYHGTTLYDEQVRVPFIVSLPSVGGRVFAGPVQLVDLAPTVLGLLGIPIPARMRGTDLGPWLSPQAGPLASSVPFPPAYAEVGEQRMLVEGTEKLLCRLDLDACELYDLAADPQELSDLAAQRPDRVRGLRAVMDEWLTDQLAMEPGGGEGGQVEPPAELLRARAGDLSAIEPLMALWNAQPELPSALRLEIARTLGSLPVSAVHAAALARAAAAAPVQGELRGWLAIAAFRAGGELGDEVAALVTRPEPNLAHMAALVLAERGRADGFDTLVDALERCIDVNMCQRLVAAFGILGDARAIPVLIERLPDVLTRRQVVSVLGALRARAAIPHLIERLYEDEYVPVRAEAALALGHIGGSAVRSALRKALGREKEEPVRAAIRAALRDERGEGSGSAKSTPAIDRARAP